MRSIGLAVALTLSLTFEPVATEAKSGTMYRVGVIFFGSPETASLGAFGQRLAELG